MHCKKEVVLFTLVSNVPHEEKTGHLFFLSLYLKIAKDAKFN